MDVDGILDEISKPENEQTSKPGFDLLPKQQPLFRNSKLPLKIKPVKKREDSGPVEVKGLPDVPEKVIGVDTRGLPAAPTRMPAEQKRGDQAPQSQGGDTPDSGRPYLEGELCALNTLPDGAILARDIYTADGRLFIHVGTELTPRIVSILSDLHELGHPVESIWVSTEKN